MSVEKGQNANAEKEKDENKKDSILFYDQRLLFSRFL